MKKFKKEIVGKQPSFTNIFDGRNSLNRYINIHSRAPTKAVIDFNIDKELTRDFSCTKISKIEYQVRRHWLKKKKYIKPIGHSVISSGNHGFNKLIIDKDETLKTEMSEQSLQEERDTRNTSKASNMNSKSKNLDKEVDSSFMIADIDLGDKKESQKHEKRVSEKMNRRVYKTLPGGAQRVFKSKSYGWNWGNAIDPTLDWWRKAEVWLKYAFQGSAKAFGAKDKKVFKELINMDVKKESKNTDYDDRIPLTGKLFILRHLVCIENDLKRTFPNDKYFQSSESKTILFNVLKAYTLYDNKWGYVQGMNFIAASLIYHSSPEIAFWLFVSLIFDYQLRDNYRIGFPGIKEINEDIKNLLRFKCPKLSKLFIETETDFEMFSLEIIMSLFGIAVPLSWTVRLLFFIL
jgi:hypothetical protein